MWRIRLVRKLSIIIFLGGSLIFPTSVQVMSNYLNEKELHLEFTDESLFKNEDIIDSLAIPELLETNEELEDPPWIEEIVVDEPIDLPVLDQVQNEKQQEGKKPQLGDRLQLAEDSTTTENVSIVEGILEKVQDDGLAHALAPEARTLFSGQLGSIPWVVDTQGTLILGSGVFDEANNVGGRYAATDYFNHPMYSQAITRVQLTGPITLRGQNGTLNLSGDIRRGFFTDLSNVTEIEGMEFLDTSGLLETAFMFANMRALTSLDVSGLDTSNVINMQEMFQNVSSLTELDVSGLATHNVWSMQGMFQNMSSLTELDISSFDTTNLFSMTRMFDGATSLTKLDVTGLDTRNLGSLIQTFQNVSSLTELDLSDFDTSNVGSMSGMFDGATNLTRLDITGFDTRSVTDMSVMFRNVSSLTELDVSHFDTSMVRFMIGMFINATSLTKLDVSGFDTSNVVSMTHMFENVRNVTELDVSGFDTSNVTNMQVMFQNVRSVTELDVSGFDTSNVTDMQIMFQNVSSVTELDVSNFDTSNVTNMLAMFQNVSSVTELDVSGFDTRNVTNMSIMFHNVNSITKLDVSGFNTSNATDISFMFTGMSSLSKLDLSNFDTRNATSMQGMFFGVPLEQLTLGHQFVFHSANGSPSLLPLTGSATHHPNWQNVGEGTVDAPKGSFVFTSAQLMENYDGNTMADTWVWQPRSFANVTIEVEGQGSVSPDYTTSVERGERIEISATPEAGWRFSHWRIESGDGTITDTGQPTTTLMMGEEDTKLVAVFENLENLLSIRIPTSAIFYTTSESSHRRIVSPNYEISNESPFAVSVEVVAPTELKNMAIIEELYVAAEGAENLLINQGHIYQREPFRLFDIETEETTTFTFTGTAEELAEESRHITPTFNIVLRFIPKT